MEDPKVPWVSILRHSNGILMVNIMGVPWLVMANNG
jgi:hypothetical protein